MNLLILVFVIFCIITCIWCRFKRLFWYILWLLMVAFTAMGCSSKDILMRVVAQNLSPELTLVEKVHSWYIWFDVHYSLSYSPSTDMYRRYQHLFKNCVFGYILKPSFNSILHKYFSRYGEHFYICNYCAWEFP